MNEVIKEFDIIKFGMYPQDTADKNDKQDIEWLVLEKKDDKALLISKYILDCKRYNNELKAITWKESDLRKWLNNDFINIAFTELEQKKILDTKNEDSVDKIFCLSVDEYIKYFGAADVKGERDCLTTTGTEYAKRETEDGCKLFIFEGVFTVLDVSSYAEYGIFWTRSLDTVKNRIKFVQTFGSISDAGMGKDVNDNETGIRPTLWLDISK